MYHEYTREALQTLAPIADKVLSVHGERRPELAEVVTLVRDLTSDLLPHMLKEEQVLFPYVGQLQTELTERETDWWSKQLGHEAAAAKPDGGLKLIS